MPPTESVRFGEVDLTTCDREPIHQPGSIQPHGVLLVVDRAGLVVRRFAGDTRFLLGVEPARVLQLPLATLFEDEALAPIGERLAPGPPVVAPSVLLGVHARGGALPLDLSLHGEGDIAVIEVEPARRARANRGDPLALVKAMLAAIQAGSGLDDCCRVACAEVRAATGFDRVMIYEFLADGGGAVVAEDKADGLEAFLGLHYPASDIPAQARELYRRNWLRLIPDTGYEPAPLTPEDDPRAGPPLDMTHCGLRGVSPIHIEYLRNMGVTASLSISIVDKDRLLGLIACHHRTPRYLPTDLRVALELFGQIFSLHLAAKREAETSERRVAARRVHEELVRRVALAPRVGLELARRPTLLDLVGAAGAAVWFDGELHTVGAVPPPEFIRSLVAWLNQRDLPLFETHHLAAAFPAAEPHAAEASGLLALSVSREPRDYLLWFRPEVARSVTWAGDPRKPVDSGAPGGRLTPRKSFEAWREEVRSRATPWDAVEIEAAQVLRVTLLETVLRQADLARREREAAAARQSLLMAELDHRVKNILATIQALVHQTKAGQTSLDSFVEALERRIRAMAAAHSLLAAARWEGVTLRGLIEEELAPFRGGGDDRLTLTGDAVTLSPKAALSLSLVLHELVTNAMKYGGLSEAQGGVLIGWRIDPGRGGLLLDWREHGGPPVLPPTRRGFGSVVIERSLGHELNGAATLTFDADGVVCRIAIPADHLVDANLGEP